MIFLSWGNHPTISRKSFSIIAHKIDEGEKLVQHETSFSWQSKGWISWMMWNEVKPSILRNPYSNPMMKVVHVLISVVRKLAQRGHVAFQFTQLVNINTCCCHCLVAQSCLTLCNPMDCSPPGSSVRGISQSRILGGLPFPPPGDLPDPGMEPVSPASPALQADSLPLSHWGSLKLNLLEKFIFKHYFRSILTVLYLRNKILPRMC